MNKVKWSLVVSVLFVAVLMPIVLFAEGNPEVDMEIVFAGDGQQTISFDKAEEGDDIPVVAFEVPDGRIDLRISHWFPPGIMAVVERCQTYVPDSMMDEFPGGTPFSSVPDWSWQAMLGATPDEGWPQLVCFGVQEGAFAGRYDGNDHFESFVAWRQTILTPLVTETPTPTSTPEPTPTVTPEPTPTETPTPEPEKEEIDPREDVDQEIVLTGELGSMHLEAVFGVDDLFTVKVFGESKYDVRIGSAEPVQILTENTSLSCEVYVPDEFGQVSDWSFENMLGASPSDGWSQTICRGVEEFPVYAVSNSAVVIAWRQIVEPPEEPVETPTPKPMPEPTPIRSVLYLPDLSRWIDPRTDVDREVVLADEIGSIQLQEVFGVDDRFTVKIVGEGRYDIRIGSAEPVQVLTEDTSIACEVYLPERFGEVSDWSFENMLGANPSDAWSQTICRGVEEFPVYAVSNSAVVIAWRQR